MSNIADKVVVITGASSGVGESTARLLAGNGAKVALGARRKDRIDALVRDINAKGGSALGFKTDVTKRGDVEALVRGTVDKYGRIDAIVNNSGIIRDRTIKKMSLEEFESIVRVNLTGPFNVIQKAASILQSGGRVINMSSVSGQMGLFGQANYSSSKAAIIALTKVSAREFARQNVTVNAIAPGFIDVGMSKGMPDEVTQNFIKQIPLGRLGEAHEIVDAALFLASPMASYITGHVLNVNGGFYLG